LAFRAGRQPCGIEDEDENLPGIALAGHLSAPALAFENDKEEDRVRDAAQVLKEIVKIPDNIPKDLFDRAECVVILPSVKKFAIGIGGSYGRGVMSCRSNLHFTGPWGPPAMHALEGGNIGLQLGGQATDFALLVLNPCGAESLMGSKVRLGADVAAAGPKGCTATGATDVVMQAEILSCSRSRGLFAGVSLEGSTLRPDSRANRKLYGREVTAKEILRKGKVARPESEKELMSVLNHHSRKISPPRNH
jgi:lipid-binding SYLF domain-containing protein